MRQTRVRERFDVHCMECGRSYETTRFVNRCTFKCRSENIICEENSKYVMENIFPGKERHPDDGGLDLYTLHLEIA